MMKYVNLLLIFITFSCGNTKNTPKTSVKTDQTLVVNQTMTTITPSEKAFYGFDFIIPKDWQETVSNLKATDLQGHIKTIETDYQLNKNDMIRLVFHSGKSGSDLFQSYQNSQRKNIYHISINKMPAVKMIEWMSKDGKGNLLAQPMTRTKIFVINPKQKGSLEIVFDLKDKNKKAIAEFDSFLNSLKPAM